MTDRKRAIRSMRLCGLIAAATPSETDDKMANVIASRFDYDLEPLYLNEDMSNKLFCTFATEDSLESVLEQIQERYKIIYNKLFVLYSKSQDEYICTYNVDFGNVGAFLENTILVHRKKESNTLYTINALNTLISIL